MSKDSYTDWRDQLWCRYNELFHRDAPFATGLATMPIGWREIVTTLLNRIETIVRADKLGRLTIKRLHHSDGMLDCGYALAGFRLSELVEEAVDHTRARASCTCDVCGAPGRRYFGVRGASARCETHRLPETREITPNWPMIRVERQIIEGVSRITRCRIYDRYRDRFVDRPPADLGIPDVP